VTLLIGLALTLSLHRSHLLHPLMADIMGPPTESMPYPVRKIDPTCRLRGWRHLAHSIDGLRERLRAEEGADPVLAGVSWSQPGALGVYCDGHPQAYSVGLLQGDRHSQYDFWTNPLDHGEEFKGRTFVIVGPVFRRVREGFEKVEEPVNVVYTEDGRPLAGWAVYVCRGFKGFPAPPEAAH
jgi:hypothetical protein